MLQVQCPKCRQKMNYAPRATTANKSKKCVYCGASFVVSRDRIVKRF